MILDVDRSLLCSILAGVMVDLGAHWNEASMELWG